MDLYHFGGNTSYIENLTGQTVLWTGRGEPITIKPFNRSWYRGHRNFEQLPSYYHLNFESNGEKVPISTDHLNRCCDKGYVCRAYLYTLLFAILPSLSLIIFGAINMGAITL